MWWGIFEEGFLFLEFMLWQQHLENGSVISCFFSELVAPPLTGQMYSAFRYWCFENTVSRGSFFFSPRDISCEIPVYKPERLEVEVASPPTWLVQEGSLPLLTSLPAQELPEGFRTGRRREVWKSLLWIKHPSLKVDPEEKRKIVLHFLREKKKKKRFLLLKCVFKIMSIFLTQRIR